MQGNPYADIPKAFDALVTTGTALRLHRAVGTTDNATVTRDTWYKAVKNLLDSGRLDKKQTRKLKSLRDEMRRTRAA